LNDNSTSLCFDEINCFYVVKLSTLDAISTNETTFTVGDQYYLAIDFANVTEPNITANLTETIICLANDVNCYIPSGLVPPEGATGDQSVKCLWGWCYIVGEPYNPIPVPSDNSTEPVNPNVPFDENNITLCIDE